MNQRGFANIIFISVIVALVGVIGYLTIVKKPTTNAPSEQSPTQSTNSSPTPITQNSQISPQTNNSDNSTEKTYRGNSFEFNYPSILSVTSQGESVSINHAVSYRHANPCDFKGDAPPLDKITDLAISLRLFNSGLKDTMRANETDYLMNNFFQGATIRISLGFIDEFNVGNLRGYRVTSGVEGCGRYTYYFSLAANKTLFMSRGFISEFQPINADYQTYLNVPGVISPAQEENYFKIILSSFKSTP